MATPGEFLFSQFDRGIAQIPGPQDQLDVAMKRARLQQMREAHELEQKRQRNLDFEVKMGLWEKFGAEMPDGGLDLINGALDSIEAGFHVAPEFVKQGGKYLSTAAEYLQNGQAEQAQRVLALGMDRKVFRSTKDAQEFVRLQGIIAKDQAQRTAELAKPVPDYVKAAQDRLDAYHKGEGQYVYGGNEQEQFEASMRDAFVMEQGKQIYAEQDRLRRMFELNPALASKALDVSLDVATDPRKIAYTRIAGLMMRYDELNQDEMKELQALATTYGTAEMQLSLQLRTERTNAQLLNKQLADIQNRRDVLSQAFSMQGQAQADAGEIAAGFQAYKDGLGENPTVEEVSGARIQLDGLNTRLSGADQAYRQSTMGPAQFLQQEATQAQAQANTFKMQAARASAASREVLLERAREAEHVAQSSEAAHRLLTDLNPYSLAKLEANVAILQSEVADRKAHGADMEEVDRQLDAARGLLEQRMQERDQARATVQAEHLRVMQREKIMRAKMTEAERKAEREGRLVNASQAVFDMMQKGMSYDRAVVTAAKDFELPPKDIRDQAGSVIEPLRLTQGQMAMGAAINAFRAQFNREPSESEMVEVQNKVMKQYPGLKREDLLKGLVKSSIDLHVVSAEERGKIAETRAAISRISEIERGFKPEYVGFLDKKIGNIQQFFSALPQEQADWYASVEQYGIEQRHRIFGSALTKTEKASAIAAIPNAGMSDQEFRAAIKESKKWEERILGERTGVAEEVGVKAPLPIPKLSPKKQRMFDELRQANPNEDVHTILKFLEQQPD